MSTNLNRITLTGNVGVEPEQREFDSGAKVTKFCIAVNRWNKKEEKEVVDWIDVETFSKLGDYVKKGVKVAVDGKLISNTYENKDGVTVKRFYVLADTIEILTPKKDGETTKPQKEEAPEEAPLPEAEPEDYGELIDEDSIPF